MVRQAWVLGRKDLSVLLRDRWSLALLFGGPVVLVAILGLTSGRVLLDNRQHLLSLVVVDLDRSEVSREVVQSFQADPSIAVHRAADERQGKQLLQREQKTALVVIGAEFTERVGELRLPDLLDPTGGRLAGGLSTFDVRVHSRTIVPFSSRAVSQLLFLKCMRIFSRRIVNRTPLLVHCPESSRRYFGRLFADSFVALP